MIRRVLMLVEIVGAIALAAVATLTFVAVLLRYVFNAPLPDAFDFSRLVMATVIVWGIAAASYRGSHIQFEVLWQAAGPGLRRAIDVIATLVTLGAIAVLTYALGLRVHASYLSQGTTSGLGIPLWPFQVAAWIGAVLATVLLAVRTVRMLGRQAIEPPGEREHKG